MNLPATDTSHPERSRAAALDPAQLGVFAVFVLGFLVQPLLFVLLAAMYGAFVRRPPRSFFALLVALLAVYLGLINSTKVPESDLEVYLDWFRQAQGMSLWALLASVGKEPLYFAFLHTVASLPFSSEAFFVFISTLLGYGVYLGAVARLGLAMRLPPRALTALIVGLAFFAPNFAISAHLMRQFLAGALVVHFFTERALTGRARWWVLGVAALVHSSAALFVPLALVRTLWRLPLLPRLILGGGLFYLASELLQGDRRFLEDVPFVGYLLVRAFQDQYFALAQLGTLPIVVVLVVTALSLYGVYASRTPPAPREVSMRELFVSTILLGATVLVVNGSEATAELAVRFYFYIYFLAGPVLAATVFLGRLRAVAAAVLLVLAPVHFFWSLSESVWKYAPVGDLMVRPVPFYVLSGR